MLTRNQLGRNTKTLYFPFKRNKIRVDFYHGEKGLVAIADQFDWDKVHPDDYVKASLAMVDWYEGLGFKRSEFSRPPVDSVAPYYWLREKE